MIHGELNDPFGIKGVMVSEVSFTTYIRANDVLYGEEWSSNQAEISVMLYWPYQLLPKNVRGHICDKDPCVLDILWHILQKTVIDVQWIFSTLS